MFIDIIWGNKKKKDVSIKNKDAVSSRASHFKNKKHKP